MFNQSPVEGHLGCFRFLAITNKATVDIFVQVLSERRLSFLWDKCPRVQFLGHKITACLVCKKPSESSRVAVPLFIPTSNVSSQRWGEIGNVLVKMDVMVEDELRERMLVPKKAEG